LLGLTKDCDPPVSAFQVAEIIGIVHHTWTYRIYLDLWNLNLYLNQRNNGLICSDDIIS
jgi:hypothetical protein